MPVPLLMKVKPICFVFEVLSTSPVSRRAVVSFLLMPYQHVEDPGAQREVAAVQVGILDDGIACAPESVERRLQAAMAARGHLAVEAIDLFARTDAETHDHAASEVFAAGPPLVPPLGKGRAVEIEGCRVGCYAQKLRAHAKCFFPRDVE